MSFRNISSFLHLVITTFCDHIPTPDSRVMAILNPFLWSLPIINPSSVGLTAGQSASKAHWNGDPSCLWGGDKWLRGPFYQRFFQHNSDSLEISSCAHAIFSETITTKFCIWHDSCAVVPCAKFCSDMIPCNDVTSKPNFHRIWIALKNRWWNGLLDWRGVSLMGSK